MLDPMHGRPLLRNVVNDLENARNNEECSLTLYFTKESHIHTLVNLVLQSGLPIANRRIPELDYCVSFFYNPMIRIIPILVTMSFAACSRTSRMYLSSAALFPLSYITVPQL